MKIILLTKIKFENRQRRYFNEKALIELSNSIQKKGLLHPVVLRNDSQTLVAGERRLRAITMLDELGVEITYDGQTVPQNTIPYVILSELSPDDIAEAELEENILRADLTWQEEAAAVDALHRLRMKQSEGKQTFKDTAEEIIGTSPTSSAQVKVRDAILLTENLSDPDIAKAKTQKEAMKILKRKKEQELTNTLAQEFETQKTPHIFNLGDFRDFADFIPTSSISLILTDPPYGISANTFGDQAATTHNYEDSPEYFREIMEGFANECSRVTKDKAHAYIFCDFRHFPYISELFTSRGWDVWPTPLIWAKGNGMLPKPDYGPRRTYEILVFANKGNKPINAVYPDVISTPGIQKPAYGAEKPAALYLNLIKRSCRPGDTIWDAFIGAGPVFAAANSAATRVVGTELCPDKYAHAKLRMNDTVEDEDLSTLFPLSP